MVQIEDLLHRPGYPLLERYQGLPQCGLADVADDAGGDLLVGLVAPGAFEVGFGVAMLVQQQAYLAQLLAGEIAGPVDHHGEGRRLVELVVDKVVEALQVIAGLVAHPVVLRALLELNLHPRK